SARRYVSFPIPRSLRNRAGSVSCPFVVTFTISPMSDGKEFLLLRGARVRRGGDLPRDLQGGERPPRDREGAREADPPGNAPGLRLQGPATAEGAGAIGATLL